MLRGMFKSIAVVNEADIRGQFSGQLPVADIVANYVWIITQEVVIIVLF